MIPDTLFSHPNQYYAVRYDTGFVFRKYDDVKIKTVPSRKMDTLSMQDEGVVVVNIFGDTLFLESYYPIAPKIKALFPKTSFDSIQPSNYDLSGLNLPASSFIEIPEPRKYQPYQPTNEDAGNIFRYEMALMFAVAMVINIYLNRDKWSSLFSSVAKAWQGKYSTQA